MLDRLLNLVIVLLVLLIAALIFLWQPSPQKTALIQPTLPAGGDFTLVSADGAVSLSDFRGRLTLLYFGYTHCPDICPTSLSATSEALRRLEDGERSQVAMLFVSVDPARDTPEHLKRYVAFFDPLIVGLSGTLAQVREVAGRYGVVFQHQPPREGHYAVDHSTDTFLIGRSGEVLARIPHATPPDDLVALIRFYLTPLRK